MPCCTPGVSASASTSPPFGEDASFTVQRTTSTYGQKNKDGVAAFQSSASCVNDA